MASPENILYTGTATATGGRAGTARSSDGALSVTLTTPKQLGGDGAAGTNPEQMFAAGYSACSIGAMKAVASGMTGQPKVALPVGCALATPVCGAGGANASIAP